MHFFKTQIILKEENENHSVNIIRLCVSVLPCKDVLLWRTGFPNEVPASVCLQIEPCLISDVKEFIS